MRKYLLSLFISVFTMCAALAQIANAQVHITGKVIDTITREPLVGATIVVKGTTTATTASLDGSFKIKVPSGDQTIVVTFVGYVPQSFHVRDADKNLGIVQLSPNSSNMKEVTITGDVAIDRKTPVAVTTISQEFIEEHISNGDIPDLLQGVPGVYTTQGDGGFGDGRVSIRGFSSRSGNGNVAYTINGVPVNDPETGAIYFSDFSGITDVTRSIQVQRGLGASKIIIPSFGGTINVTTRTTDQQGGGFVSEGIGSDGFNKTAIQVSTGLLASGWAATFAGSRTEGAYPFDGSNFLAYNYFFNLSKQLTPTQLLSFNIIGSNQTHGQRPEQLLYPSTNTTTGTNTPGYLGAPQGLNWNGWYGYKDGQTYNPYNNSYSEPIISLNHEWTISSKSSLSTVLYAIIGRGNGGGIDGVSSQYYSINSLPRSGGIYSPINYSAIEAYNAANSNGSALTYADASVDNTEWYGLRSTYRTLLGKYIDLSAGIDLRYYKGDHYDKVTDLLGASYVAFPYTGNPALGQTGGNINDPAGKVGMNGIIDYHNIDNIESGGAFAQAEYSKDNFSAFATVSGSEDADRRQDPFDYLNGDPNQTSRWVNFTTYQAKVGANYNLNSQMNVFANVGYLTKPPYFGNVFEDYTNKINESAISEKLLAYELGYNFKISTFSAKVNLFREDYKDRAFASAFSDPTTDQLYSANISGVNEMHEGGELELTYRPVQQILIGGTATVGDYYYTSNSGPVSVLNSQGTVIATTKAVYLKNEKIGDIPQNMFSLYTDVKIVPQLKIGARVIYYTDYTSYVPFQNYTSQNQQPYVVPNYAIWSMNATYKFKMSGFDAELIGNVNNLLNSKSIADAEDYNGTGNLSALQVYWMNARTFTTTLKVRF
jgi:iron complex outermembrane receptor protein